MAQIEPYGIDINHARDLVLQGKHNHITATYYLQIKKYKNDPQSTKIPSNNTQSNNSFSNQNISLVTQPIPPPRPMSTEISMINPKIKRFLENIRVESTGGSSSKENDLAYRTQDVTRGSYKRDTSTRPTPRERLYAKLMPQQPIEARSVSSGPRTGIKYKPKEPEAPKPTQPPRSFRGRQFKSRKSPINSNLDNILSISTRHSPRAATAMDFHSRVNDSSEFSFR